MSETDLKIAERVALAVRNGKTDELRALLTQHPQCRAFLDLPETVTGSRLDTWLEYAEKHGHSELKSLFRTEFPDPVYPEIYEAIRLGNVNKVRQLFQYHPRYAREAQGGISSWLKDAADFGQVAVAELLLGMGADVNARLPFGATVLGGAIRSGNPKMVEWLLSSGAVIDGPDPDGERPIVHAISREPEEVALRLVELLVEHGVEVNREYTVFGDKNDTITALEWAAGKPKIAEYLRSKGAIERNKKVRATFPAKNLAEEVIAYFRTNFGPPQPQAQIEIVPTEPGVAIHVIPTAEDRKYVTLFTTGMSEQPMDAPEGTEDFRVAELFIQLPSHWPIDQKSLAKPVYSWPINWLRSIAKYPHQQNTWLGGPVTIIANGDPPEPLAPGLKFTSFLVMADRNFASQDGRTVYLYRVLPLYTEERNLEIKKGIAALMRALDKYDIPSVVDLNRPNVGLAK